VDLRAADSPLPTAEGQPNRAKSLLFRSILFARFDAGAAGETREAPGFQLICSR
jgi:hypothetical protein